MNIFFKLGKWWEDRKGVNNLSFESRIRVIERAQEAQMKLSQSLMLRMRRLEEFTKVNK